MGPPTTFHGFPRLPAELRTQIWELTIEPRIIYLEFKTIVRPTVIRSWGIMNQERERILSIKSTDMLSSATTSVPAPLHTCREARNELQRHYQRALSELYEQAESYFNNRTIFQEQQQRSQHRDQHGYAWVNFDIDVIHIGHVTEFGKFRAIAPLVQRLRIRGDYAYSSQTIQNLLNTFDNAREVFIEPAYGAYSWRGARKQLKWPCDSNNIWIFDEKFGTKPTKLGESNNKPPENCG